MGDIEVEPEALRHLGQQVSEEVGQAGQARSEAIGRGDVSTGSDALTASLHGFFWVWGRQLIGLEQSGEQLAGAITTAAANYEDTDRAVMPSSDGVDGEGGSR